MESLWRWLIRAGRHFRLSSVPLDARFDVALEYLELVGAGRVAHHGFHDIPQVIVKLSILAESLETIDEIWRVFLLCFLDSAADMSPQSILPLCLLN